MRYWPFQISLLDEEVCGSALYDRSSVRMSPVKRTRENTRCPSFVIHITPSLIFPLISCIPKYSPRNAAFWGFAWKCIKQKISDCSGPTTMWFNCMAVSWCDKPQESLSKCKRGEKILSRSLSAVAAFCFGRVCVLGLGWNSTSIRYYPFVIACQVARWNAVSATSFIPSFPGMT